MESRRRVGRDTEGRGWKGRGVESRGDKRDGSRRKGGLSGRDVKRVWGLEEGKQREGCRVSLAECLRNWAVKFVHPGRWGGSVQVHAAHSKRVRIRTQFLGLHSPTWSLLHFS